jgi:glycerol-3-phosphate acyltransferase PlsY
MSLGWSLGPILLCYVLGSINMSYLLTRYQKGIDIREIGSGNAGATNVSRVLGRGPALFTFFFDFLKGILAVTLAVFFHGNETLRILCGIAVVAGHNWPLFFQFRGGKGFATTLGLTLSLAPMEALIAAGASVGVILATRYISLGALVYALLFPIVWFVQAAPPLLPFGLYLVIPLLLVVRHRQNIRDLLSRRERKIF